MTTRANHFRKAFTTNVTSSSAFTAKTPSATIPSGDGVITPPYLDQSVDNYVVLKPYGSAADDVTFSFQVWGWTYNHDGAVYEPCLLMEYDCTAGNIARGSSFFDCDTISEIAGDTDTTRTVSPGSNKGSAHTVLDIMGFQIIEFEAKVSTATAVNVLYRFTS